MISDHYKYLFRCVQIAKRGGKSVKSNPQVGAVLVYQNRIIGEGYHQEYGAAHAEVNAIRSVSKSYQNLISESTLYVSLEPCNHHGKTGPCTDLIIKNYIKHVVIAAKDPNRSVRSNGLEKLKASGIKVELLPFDAAYNLIRPFTLGSLNNLPYVILKFAQSKDFYIGKEGEQIWITNRYSKHLVHKWRSEIDGIMVGTNTVLTDNPKLTNRLHPGESPIRIIPDRHSKINSSHDVLSDDMETWIYQDTGDLKSLLQELYTRGISRLMIEGGAKLLKSFIAEKLWHEARILTGNKTLKSGIKAPVIKGKLISTQSIGLDTISTVFAP